MPCPRNTSHRRRDGSLRHRALLILLLLSATLSFPTQGAEVVFRIPFTLKLLVDVNHVYEEHFAKIPYVLEGSIYLFSQDAFGVNLGTKSPAARALAYDPPAGRKSISMWISHKTFRTAPQR